jgi:hypothetical protein
MHQLASALLQCVAMWKLVCVRCIETFLVEVDLILITWVEPVHCRTVWVIIQLTLTWPG